MKVRCTANHLRFRLRKSDVEELSSRQSVRETIHVAPGQSLAFELAIAPAEVAAPSFLEGLLRIALPAAAARHWIETEEVGIELQHRLDNGDVLDILIEKDFPCKHQPQEDKGDTFQELAKKRGSAEVKQ